MECPFCKIPCNNSWCIYTKDNIMDNCESCDNTGVLDVCIGLDDNGINDIWELQWCQNCVIIEPDHNPE